MNANEAIIIDRMAECIEQGLSIHGRFSLLHTQTQNQIREVALEVLEDQFSANRQAIAQKLRDLAEGKLS